MDNQFFLPCLKLKHLPMNHHILIVDDNYEDALLIREAFREVNPFVQTNILKSSGELIHFLKKNKAPDLVLLDLEMPGADGLETLKEIKGNPSYTELPVIVFSNTNDPSKIDLCYKLKANSFVRKPFDYLELTDTIKTIDFLLYKITSGQKVD